jgi:hypothetical protein
MLTGCTSRCRAPTARSAIDSAVSAAGEPRVDDDRVGPVHLPKRDHGASVRRSRTARIGLAAEAR